MPPLYRMLEVCVYSLTNFLPFLAMALYPFRRRLRFSPAVAAALVAVLTLLFVGGEDYSPLALLAIALVCTGAIGLGVVDATEDPELRLERQKASNYKYAKSFLALALPAAYCRLDAAGEKLMQGAFDRLGLTGRSHDRILRMARTIADLEGEEQILPTHLAEAIQYRSSAKLK